MTGSEEEERAAASAELWPGEGAEVGAEEERKDKGEEEGFGREEGKGDEEDGGEEEDEGEEEREEEEEEGNRCVRVYSFDCRLALPTGAVVALASPGPVGGVEPAGGAEAAAAEVSAGASPGKTSGSTI